MRRENGIAQIHSPDKGCNEKDRSFHGCCVSAADLSSLFLSVLMKRKKITVASSLEQDRFLVYFAMKEM